MDTIKATEVIQRIAKHDVETGEAPTSPSDISNVLREWRDADPEVDDAYEVLRKSGKRPEQVYADTLGIA